MRSTKAEREHEAWVAARGIRAEAEQRNEEIRMGNVKIESAYQRTVVCCGKTMTIREFLEHNERHA